MSVACAGSLIDLLGQDWQIWNIAENQYRLILSCGIPELITQLRGVLLLICVVFRPPNYLGMSLTVITVCEVVPAA